MGRRSEVEGDPHAWAMVDDFGADPKGIKDSSAAIQKTIDSGAETIFLPGSYNLHAPVIIRGKVRRIVGVGGWIDYHKKTSPDFVINDGDSPIVSLEHFGGINGGIEIATTRTVVLKSMEVSTIVSKGAGDVFLEDVCTHDLIFRKQNVWARQLNVENEGTHLVNDGGALWILGYKTERGGTLLETRGGGHTELFGNFSYTTTAGKLAPMLVNTDSSVFAFFGEVCFNGDPFQTLIRETRLGETRVISLGQGSTAPYVGARLGK